MSTHVDKTQENRGQAPENVVTQKMNSGAATSLANGITDNRPGTAMQRKLQEMANNSVQAKQVARLQVKANNHTAQQQNPIQRKANNTGLPDNLKTGMEHLSGMSLDDVKVHYNSNKPAQLQAHAYAQGNQIHLGSGQEKHLPHESWHVVQQKRGRVKPTLQMKGKVNINDDANLEKEADVMGAKAAQNKLDLSSVVQGKLTREAHGSISALYPIQRAQIALSAEKGVTNPESATGQLTYNAYVSDMRRWINEIITELPIQMGVADAELTAEVAAANGANLDDAGWFTRVDSLELIAEKLKWLAALHNFVDASFLSGTYIYPTWAAADTTQDTKTMVISSEEKVGWPSGSLKLQVQGKGGLESKDGLLRGLTAGGSKGRSAFFLTGAAAGDHYTIFQNYIQSMGDKFSDGLSLLRSNEEILDLVFSLGPSTGRPHAKFLSSTGSAIYKYYGGANPGATPADRNGLDSLEAIGKRTALQNIAILRLHTKAKP
jgi:hypothetical protein